ncbi:cell polarity protein [Coprinopsis marcescibilis]|uniref:Cell polarity protein n=1 Tax=Coprinopsis marcescibilis TaxID=230819 RepID=A0A5C3KSY6_COPMA|nr:cell polarity protein [Coprinopsis marcescibilis]
MSMKRPSRAPSPTPTSFSGVSAYRTDSYRTSGKNGPGAGAQIDYRQVSKTHFEELSKYLAAYLARSQPNSRSTARQKLTRLTIQQFHELSTDEFHPKRNQARQKLATLPTSRFEDLSSDVYFELARRYPEFKEDPSGRGAESGYDDYPAPDYGSSSSRNGPLPRNSTDRSSDSGYASNRRPSDDRRRPSEADFPTPPRRSEESYRRPEDYPGARGNDDTLPAALASRRKPSQDVGRKSEDREREFIRRPSGASASNASDNTATGDRPSQSTTATSGMVIPIKSTMEEEYIEVPYGRDERESTGNMDTPNPDLARDIADDSASEYPSPLSARSPPAGLSGLTARLKLDDDDEDPSGAGNKSGDDFYDKYGRASVNSDRSAGGRGFGGRASVADEDKIRRDYEFKIATMQSQITNLQREASEAKEKERLWMEAQSRVAQLEDELTSFRRKAEEHSNTILTLQRDLDELKETRQRDREREARRTQDDEEEIQILRDRCEELESQRGALGEADKDIVDQLQNDMEGLILELGNLSRRNDELMTAKDSDLAVIRDLDAQLKEYKRKYEQAKTELRSIKTTSQLFLPTPKFEKSDDQLPVATDGGVLDIHITAFMSAVDSLLTAGRSNAPTRVLAPMKTVVNAVTNIIDDARAFERRPIDREVDLDALKALRERAEATLGNLTAASRTHATSNGMSPVSLLDAAASHVSSCITEISRLVRIRKSTKAEQDQFQYSSPPPSATNGYMPSLRAVGESGSSFNVNHQRKASQASVSSNRNRFVDSPSSPPNRTYVDSRRRPPSQNSSSEKTNSPTPLFDRQPGLGGAMSDDSAPLEGEDAWAELKPYLEAQTESIVYAIQSVLSAVRSPTPAPTLNENLTQIITIVSSIVAVCNDNLPSASVQQGNDFLRELGDHANKLSEVQAMPEITKESRQVMAKSSFAIANAMKGLMKLS